MSEGQIHEMAFQLLRTQRALECANKVLNENGLIGVLVDCVNAPDQYEEDHITALLEEFSQ